MRWVLATWFAVAVVLPGLVQAEPLSVSFEWVEFEYKQNPISLKPFAPPKSQFMVLKNSDPAFVELGKHAKKKTLVKHLVRIEPGSSTAQSTQLGGKSFDFSLAVESLDQEKYLLEVNATFKDGIFEHPKPGEQLTPEQMKPVKVTSMSNTIELSKGRKFTAPGIVRMSGQKNSRTVTALVIRLMDPQAVGSRPPVTRTPARR